MVDITLQIANITIREDGDYMIQLKQQPSGQNYTVRMTAAQCSSLANIQSAANALAQPFKFLGQNIVVTL